MTGGFYFLTKKVIFDNQKNPFSLGSFKKSLWPQEEKPNTKNPQIIAKKEFIEKSQNQNNKDFQLNPYLKVEAQILSTENDPYLKIAFKGYDIRTKNEVKRFQVKFDWQPNWQWSGEYFQIKLEPQKPVNILVRAVDNNFVSQPIIISYKNNLSLNYGKIKLYLLRKEKLILEIKNISQESIDLENFILQTPVFVWQFKKTNKILFPYPAEVKEKLILKPRESLVVVADYSPVGSDFMLNSCLAFYPNLNLYPYKPNFCFLPPIPETFPSFCKEKLEKIRCAPISLESFAKEFNLYYDCFEFVKQNFTYEGCFAKNHQKDNFLQNIWYIFIGPKQSLKKYDFIELKDSQGLLIERVEIK